MSDHARVSVLIPAYNMAEYVGTAIESALDGNYDNLEVICVNDGSTDETEQIIRQYTDPRSDQYDDRVSYFSQSNRGKSVAVNHGIGEMCGEYFTFLDADDRLPPHSLTRRVEALSSNPDADVAIGGFEVIEENGSTPVGERSCPTFQNPKKLKRAFCLSYKTPFHLNACLFRRSVADRVGSFDDQLDRCQDIDYSIRCMEEIQDIALVDAPVYQYRKHRDSVWERVVTRIGTIKHRPIVILKNYYTPQNYFYVLGNILLDLFKMSYEIFGSYKK